MPNAANELQGPVRIFAGIAANATTGTPDVIPADTVALGGSWGGGWVDLGYTTEEGITKHYEFAWNPSRSAQESTPTNYFPGDATDWIGCTLKEATLANLKRALGRGVLTSVAAGGSPGHDLLTLSDPTTPSYLAIGWEWVAPPNTKANPRRGILPIAMAVEAVEMNMRRTTPAGLPVRFMRVGSAALSAPQELDVTTL
jgi:hypothetical protein